MPFATRQDKNDYMRRYMRIKKMRESGGMRKTAFLESLRPIVFQKYGSQCAICKINITEILTIHHMNGEHEDNRIENLQVLCFNCHFMVERHADKLYKIENWTERPMDMDLLDRIHKVWETKPQIRSGLCVFHQDKPSVVSIGYDLATGMMLPDSDVFGVCQECWSVLAEGAKPPLPKETH